MPKQVAYVKKYSGHRWKWWKQVALNCLMGMATVGHAGPVSAVPRARERRCESARGPFSLPCRPRSVKPTGQ
eukprot:4265170-Pyramimonas_sp.AAC.1